MSGPSSTRSAEPERRTASAESAHSLRGGELVRAVGREQKDPLVRDVVGEKDHEIQRGRVRPVHVLEHEQHRRRRRTIRQQRQCVLEHAQLRGRRLPPGWSTLAEWPQRLDERLVWQLGADEIDRPPEQDVEPRVACARRKLGREAALADARLAGDENGRAATGPGCVEGALELRELASASHERGFRASAHAASMAQAIRRL